ncbi:MAG TPA: hypothetical protein VH143_29755 [Kofleriaceae bacterium]|jgi:hypothetical protein|nr:hypothetical protein [Kofleriaceae bacterium]
MARPLAAFVITLGVTAPALLDANIELDGKKLRPREQTFQIDGTRVTIDVDRALAMTGDKVTATIVAYSDTPKQVELDLRLVQTHLQPGERIEPPSHQIDREKLTVFAKPDGGKVSVALVLGTPRKSLGQLDRFSIYVGPHGTPSPVNKPNYDGGGDSGNDFWQASIEAGKAASTDVMGWSGNSISMKTSAEGKLVAGQPFIVDVRIKNTTGMTLPEAPLVQLMTGRTVSTEIETADDDDVEIDALDGESSSKPVKRGAEIVRRFRVVPKHDQKQITLAVGATAFSGDIGPTLGGARDVITFHAADPDAKVALK